MRLEKKKGSYTPAVTEVNKSGKVRMASQFCRNEKRIYKQINQTVIYIKMFLYKALLYTMQGQLSVISTAFSNLQAVGLRIAVEVDRKVFVHDLQVQQPRI